MEPLGNPLTCAVGLVGLEGHAPWPQGQLLGRPDLPRVPGPLQQPKLSIAGLLGSLLLQLLQGGPLSSLAHPPQ